MYKRQVEFEADGNPVYQYQWNDVQMAQEEYEQKLNAVYDTSKARQGYEWDGWLSREDAAEAVEGMEYSIRYKYSAGLPALYLCRLPGYCLSLIHI